MDKQIQIYSVDTRSFYTEQEEEIGKRIKWAQIKKQIVEEYCLYCFLPQEKKEHEFKGIRDFYRKKKQDKKIKKYITDLARNNKEIKKSEKYKDALKEHGLYQKYKKNIDELKKSFTSLRESNKKVRELNPDKVSKYNIVSVFDSYLSRILGLDQDNLTTDVIIVRVYYYQILEQLIQSGFTYNGEQYKFFTCSAGQIRTKKTIFIKEKVWERFSRSLMCGLTIDSINDQGGCNINKFLAYLALCNSATDKWEKFDIDKAIVIDDFETEVNGEVDFVDNKSFKATRKKMNVPVNHSDGCGWILPSESKKNFMVRLPWIKGLMTPVDYLKFCKLHNNENYKVKDIYGKEWDLLKDGIKYVFTKSQFKMWKYYQNITDKSGKVIKYGWDTYKENFKEYNCHASICNEEPSSKGFKRKRFNYQMWQTLTDISDEEIKLFTEPVAEYIKNAYTDRDTMLDILGVTPENQKKNNLQQVLEIYPELLRDRHVKQELSEMINARKKEAKAGKFRIEAKNTFFIPDVFAWMWYSLGGDKNPKGLLENGQVSCKLYKNEPKLLVNRSPHLYKEHAVRGNTVDKSTDKWFKTNGIYTSCHDLISKTLQMDVDGDNALVVADHVLIQVAERNMEGVVPLYYEMGVAEPQKITAKSIYSSLTNAFKYSNIGKFSNKLTALWNSENPDIETIKAIVALNNYSIDAAKTLEMPEPVGEMGRKVNEANRIKLPYFFQFAKDKKEDKVSKINNSTVNRICREIESIKQGDFDFSKIGGFRYTSLMKNHKIEIDDAVVGEYKRLNKEMQKYFFKNSTMKKEEVAVAVWDIIKYEFSVFCMENGVDYSDAVDMVIKDIYTNSRHSRKELLFNIFGDAILTNLKNKVAKPLDGGYMYCTVCGKKAKKNSNRQKMCPGCADNKERQRKKKAS